MSQSQYFEDIIPPPLLFSPHVRVSPTEIKTFSDGYIGRSIQLEPFMVAEDPIVLSALIMAKQYKLNLNWKRELSIVVHEARGVSSSNGSRVHDVLCKFTVGDQIQRTKQQNIKANNLVWYESLKFSVTNPSNIKMLAYCKNFILPNAKLGNLTIRPDQLIERSTVERWFPFDTRGEIKLSFSLSAPKVAPFKFSMNLPGTTLKDFAGYNAFCVTKINNLYYMFNDRRGYALLYIEIVPTYPRSYKPTEFKLFRYGSPQRVVSIKEGKLNSENGIKISGLQIEIDLEIHDTKIQLFKFINHNKRESIASAELIGNSFVMEIEPNQEVLLIVAILYIIGRFILRLTY